MAFWCDYDVTTDQLSDPGRGIPSPVNFIITTVIFIGCVVNYDEMGISNPQWLDWLG